MLQEPVLRITQYLPDIHYLQKLLFDQFHQRFDQGDVLNMSINEYLKSLNNGTRIILLCLLNLFLDRTPETSNTKTGRKIQ